MSSINWILKGRDGTRYAVLAGVVVRGNTYFAAVEPLDAYASIRPIFEQVAAHLESHGVPSAGTKAPSLAALGLLLEDDKGTDRTPRDLAIVDELASFGLA